MSIGITDLIGMFGGWYTYILLLTVVFALPLPRVGGGRLLNWKGWVISGIYFSVVMGALVLGMQPYCRATQTGFDILGCGIGILVGAFLLNTIVGVVIMWYTRNW